jgi:hypothetical protein
VGTQAAAEALGSGSSSQVDALLAAQHERVGALTDFGPLLLPFFLRCSSGSGGDAEAFGAYLVSSGPLAELFCRPLT